MIIETLEWKDIPFTKVMEIRQIRANTFGDGIIKEERKVPFTDEIIFILSDKKKNILSVGCLFQITAKLLRKSYKIQWIWSIVSVEKWKWYGKILMNEIHSYLKKKKLTWIGFCSPINSPFYQKCKFSIQKNSLNRFFNTSWIWRQPPEDEDVLYLNWKDNFTKTFLSHPKATVSIPRFW